MPSTFVYIVQVKLIFNPSSHSFTLSLVLRAEQIVTLCAFSGLDDSVACEKSHLHLF